MPLAGTLSLYPLPMSPTDEKPDELPYFTSGDLSSDKALVFIGGLTSGLGSVEFVPALSGALEKQGWRVIQMAWSGQYDGFGTGSLDRDIGEMSNLIKHIRANDGVQHVVIMGHSTGSQDVIHYLTSPDYSKREPVSGGIMQAPASDRQYFANPKTEGSKKWMEALAEAEALLKEGKGDQFLNDEFCNDVAECLINAYRLHSLVGIGGDDDYFSSDIPDTDDPPTPHIHPLNKSFGTLPTPALALWSGKDEYGFLDDQTPLLRRWETAAGGKLRTVTIKDADHAVSKEQPQADLCAAVVDWLQTAVKL